MTIDQGAQISKKMQWHGVDRAQLNWYPTINEDACTGCGLCLLSCGNSVFKWNVQEEMPLVANPQKCVLGCTTCGKVCPEGAISFPENPATFIKNVVFKYKVFPKVKEDLNERLAKFPDHIVSNLGGDKIGK
ncbi:MAG: 4Fe-4S dicluster domain-containing protein [Thermoplasmata archaeon]